MKRHESIVILSRDHQKGLMLAQLVKKDAPAYKGLPSDIEGKMKCAIDTFRSDLNIHFEDEEKILFPAAVGKSIECDQLINELIDEHKFFNEKIPSLLNSSNLKEEMDLIGFKLEEHIRKEERILFNLIQDILTDKELEKLKSNIEESRKIFQNPVKQNQHNLSKNR